MSRVAEYTIPGLHVRDHVTTVPLRWDAPRDGPTLTLFARELVDPARRDEDLPLLLFLQGGPGGKGPRPHPGQGWIPKALEGHRVILMDQRGTGRSSPVDARALAAVEASAPPGVPAGEAGAAYLACFRGDAIVDDAEHLRRSVFGVERWATLGQSYGGFLTATYLSRAPGSLSACYVTGGLPGLHADADEVYRRTFPRAVAKNRRFADRYPADVVALGRIADRLDASPVLLPDGDVLSVPRLQMLGQGFGMAPGFEEVHWLLDEAFSGVGPGGEDELSDAFLAEVGARTGFDGGPLYAVLQESIYGQGTTTPGWAAERQRLLHPQFAPTARPLLLTGETMFPWMFEELRALRPFRAAVEALQAREAWPALYDPVRLAANDVPVAAIVYHDDLYVDADLSLQTAAAIGNVRAWVTNEFEHDGLRASGGRVLSRLMELVAEQGGPRR